MLRLGSKHLGPAMVISRYSAGEWVRDLKNGFRKVEQVAEKDPVDADIIMILYETGDIKKVKEKYPDWPPPPKSKASSSFGPDGPPAVAGKRSSTQACPTDLRSPDVQIFLLPSVQMSAKRRCILQDRIRKLGGKTTATANIATHCVYGGQGVFSRAGGTSQWSSSKFHPNCQYIEAEEFIRFLNDLDNKSHLDGPPAVAGKRARQ